MSSEMWGQSVQSTLKVINPAHSHFSPSLPLPLQTFYYPSWPPLQGCNFLSVGTHLNSILSTVLWSLMEPTRNLNRRLKSPIPIQWELSLKTDKLICTRFHLWFMLFFPGECLWLHLDIITNMQDFCKGVFPVVDYAYCTIPTYPSGQIGFTLCSLNPVSTIGIFFLIFFLFYNRSIFGG